MVSRQYTGHRSPICAIAIRQAVALHQYLITRHLQSSQHLVSYQCRPPHRGIAQHLESDCRAYRSQGNAFPALVPLSVFRVSRREIPHICPTKSRRFPHIPRGTYCRRKATEKWRTARARQAALVKSATGRDIERARQRKHVAAHQRQSRVVLWGDPGSRDPRREGPPVQGQ